MTDLNKQIICGVSKILDELLNNPESELYLSITSTLNNVVATYVEDNAASLIEKQIEEEVVVEPFRGNPK